MAAAQWSKEQVEREVKEHILEAFLAGASPDELENETPLMTGGILDSISTVQLVSFLEERYGVRFQAHEMDADHLNTISLIAGTVLGKG